MPKITTEVDVECNECGTDLVATFEDTWKGTKSVKVLHVEPCWQCLTEAHDEGYDEGHEAAERETDE